MSSHAAKDHNVSSAHSHGNQSHTSAHSTEDRQALGKKLFEWFFKDYVPNWAAMGRREQPEKNILGYWDVPLYKSYSGTNECLLTADTVVGFLASMHGPLKNGGYDHTTIVDPRVTIYSSIAGGVDVIWSRCRKDETEIERIAAHFEVRLGKEGWRVISATGTPTSAKTIDASWVGYKRAVV